MCARARSPIASRFVIARINVTFYYVYEGEGIDSTLPYMRNLRGTPQLPSRFVESRFRIIRPQGKSCRPLCRDLSAVRHFFPLFLRAARLAGEFLRLLTLYSSQSARPAQSGYNFAVAFARHLVNSAAPSRLSFFFYLLFFEGMALYRHGAIIF